MRRLQTCSILLSSRMTDIHERNCESEIYLTLNLYVFLSRLYVMLQRYTARNLTDEPLNWFVCVSIRTWWFLLLFPLRMLWGIIQDGPKWTWIRGQEIIMCYAPICSLREHRVSFFPKFILIIHFVRQKSRTDFNYYKPISCDWHVYKRIQRPCNDFLERLTFSFLILMFFWFVRTFAFDIIIQFECNKP